MRRKKVENAGRNPMSRVEAQNCLFRRVSHQESLEMGKIVTMDICINVIEVRNSQVCQASQGIIGRTSAKPRWWAGR